MCRFTNVCFLPYILLLSSERYTEQVTPLLVYAQRSFYCKYPNARGPDISQQACVRYETEYKQKVSLALLFMQLWFLSTRITSKIWGSDKRCYFHLGIYHSNQQTLLRITVCQYFPIQRKKELSPCTRGAYIQVKAGLPLDTVGRVLET